MSGKDEQFYTCRTCGETKFCHDVTVVYEEVFDSEQKRFTEGKPYSDGEAWICKYCGAKIPKKNILEFMEQLYDVIL